jgi:hypothetical protein
MVHPQVASGEMASIWMVTANIFNKQLWTAKKGWSSRPRVDRGATNPSPQTLPMLQTIHKFFRFGMILWYDISNARGTRDSACGM